MLSISYQSLKVQYYFITYYVFAYLPEKYKYVTTIVLDKKKKVKYIGKILKYVFTFVVTVMTLAAAIIPIMTFYSSTTITSEMTTKNWNSSTLVPITTTTTKTWNITTMTTAVTTSGKQLHVHVEDYELSQLLLIALNFSFSL